MSYRTFGKSIVLWIFTIYNFYKIVNTDVKVLSYSLGVSEFWFILDF